MNKNLILLVLAVIFSTSAISQTNIKLTTSDNEQITIPLENNSILTLDPTSGDIIAVTTVSKDEFGSALGGECSIAVAPTLSITQQPDSSAIQAGGSKIIQWTIGVTDATSCAKTGNGWSGAVIASKLAMGTHQETITNIQSNTSTFSMQCENNGLQSALVSTTVPLDNNTVGCYSSPPILGGAEDNSPADWEDVAPNNGWPGTNGRTLDFRFARNKYVALKFTTSNADFDHRLSTVSPSIQPPSMATMAISSCPGDFSTTLNQANCITTGLSFPGSIFWSTSSSSSPALFCKLEKNTEYYLNIVHAREDTAGGGYSVSGCGNSECSILGTQSIFN